LLKRWTIASTRRGFCSSGGQLPQREGDFVEAANRCFKEKEADLETFLNDLVEL